MKIAHFACHHLEDRLCARVNDSHKTARVDMAREWERYCAIDPSWMSKTEFTDESIFTLSQGKVGNTGDFYASGIEARSKKFIV